MPTETEEKIDIGAELLALSDTKTKIAEAITAKGVETSKDDKFSSYPEKIQQIQSGGGGSSVIDNTQAYVLYSISTNEVQGSVSSHSFELKDEDVRIANTYTTGTAQVSVSAIIEEG